MDRIAVIGGGINGCGISWELARRGYAVVLFDKGAFGGATSSATTKMIHGGLRYLENLDFGLVREALRERAFLLHAVPDLVRPIEIVLPHYKKSSRSRLVLRAGLTLYDALAGRDNIAPHRELSAAELLSALPLRPEGLVCGYSFFDAQVDDHALVRRVVECAVRDGVDAREWTPVTSVGREDRRWRVATDSTTESFDLVVNAVGPWMNRFLDQNEIPSDFALTLVRGSHIVLDRAAASRGALFEVPHEKRIVFVLPWKGRTLVGTTEVVHEGTPDEVEASAEEVEYLLAAFNRFFRLPASGAEIVETFSGVRPLLASRKDPTAITREYRIEVIEGGINVFGGKLTTFMSLARKVARRVDRLTGRETTALPADFALRRAA